jgi:YhcH/YjgK/YiaL family protein
MEEFNTENDIMFFNLETDQFTLKPGYFAVFFPHDIHQPGIMVGPHRK